MREIDHDFNATLHRRRLKELSCFLAAVIVILVVGFAAGWKYVVVTIVLAVLAAVAISGTDKRRW